MTIAQQLEELAGIVRGNAWGADRMRPRIYFNVGRRDAKVFADFAEDAVYPDDADSEVDGVATGLFGHVIRVYLDDCGQSPKWYASQKRRLRESMFTEALAISAYTAGDRALAIDIMERGDVTADELDDAAAHLINGRLAEARAALGLDAAVTA